MRRITYFQYDFTMILVSSQYTIKSTLVKRHMKYNKQIKSNDFQQKLKLYEEL